MLVTAELRCLNCARLLGEVTGDSALPLSAATATCPTGAPCLSLRDPRNPLCSYCGGRAFLEDIHPVPGSLAA